MSPDVFSVKCLWCLVGLSKSWKEKSAGERGAKAREDHCHFLLVMFTFYISGSLECPPKRPSSLQIGLTFQLKKTMTLSRLPRWLELVYMWQTFSHTPKTSQSTKISKPLQAFGRIKEWDPTAGQSCIIGITCGGGLLNVPPPWFWKIYARPVVSWESSPGLLGVKTKVKFELLASMA